MFKQILPFVVAACVAPCFAGEAWLTDMPAAQKAAAEQNKDLMIEFTGSDWCPPCKQLRSTVLNQEDFIKSAQKNFVLLELDYPRSKEQSPEVKKTNEQLATKYGISGFPTVVFAFPDGKPFGSFVGGRDRAGVDASIQEALKAKAAILAAQEQVAKATTDEAKVAALMGILEAAPKDFIDSFYGDVKAEVVKLDKDDKSGLKAATEKKALLEQQSAELQEYMKKHEGEAKSPAEMLKVVRAYPGLDKLVPELKQAVKWLEVQMYLMDTADVDGAVKMIDEAVAIAPKSQFAQNASQIKSGMLANKDKIKAQVAEQKARQAEAQKAQAPQK